MNFDGFHPFTTLFFFGACCKRGGRLYTATAPLWCVPALYCHLSATLQTMSYAVANLQENRAVFRIFIALFKVAVFQSHHMSVMDFVVSPPGCGWSVTDFQGWDTHEVRLRCPDEVDGDIWMWSTRRGLKPKFYWLPRPWSPCGSSPIREKSPW
jgi:hypothetical protein